MLNASLLPVNTATGLGANDLGQALLVDFEHELHLPAHFTRARNEETDLESVEAIYA